MKFLSIQEKTLYDNALSELGQSFMGYIEPVQEILMLAGREVNADKISNVRRGKVRDWQILNAIRAVRGLAMVVPPTGPTKDEIVANLKLQVA